jgi:cytochrome c556
MDQRRFLWVGLFVFLSLFISSQLFAQADVVEKRQKLMKLNSADAKAIKKALGEKDSKTVEVKAKEIMGNMDKVLELFPKGSTAENSRAKPEIWDRWDEFSKHPGKVKKAAQELVDAAKSGDDSKSGAKFKALGDACNACHNDFRAAAKKSGS